MKGVLIVGIFRVLLAVTIFLFLPVPGRGGEMADNIRQSLKKGADPNELFKADFMKIRPLHAVVGNTDDHLEAAALLLEAGANPDGRDELGNTPLHRASFRLAFRFIRLLLKHGASPNLRNDNGETPLHQLYNPASYIAYKKVSIKEQQQIKNNLIQTARILLEQGADPNIADKLGRTPLHRLAGVAEPKLLKLLIEHGADPQRKDNSNETPLEEAIFYNDDPEATEVFLKHGAGQIDIELFIRAIENHRAQQALLLLRYGAPVKGTNKAGYSPLYTAVMEALVMGKSEARMQLIRELLLRGAPKNSPGPLGDTAKELASKDPDILALFGIGRNSPLLVEQAAPDTPAGIVAEVMKEVDTTIQRQVGLRSEVQNITNPLTLTSQKEISRRIKILKSYREVLDDALLELKEAATKAGKMAGRQGFKEDAIKKTGNLLAEALIEKGEPARSDFYRAEKLWVEALLEGYRLLSENPHAWRFDKEGSSKRITVLKEDFARRFSLAVERIKKTATQAKQARQKLRQALRQLE